MWRQLERKEKSALHKYFSTGAKITKSMLATMLYLGIIISMMLIPSWQKTIESQKDDFIYIVVFILVMTLMVVFPIMMFLMEKPIYKYVEAVKHNDMKIVEVPVALKQCSRGPFGKTYYLVCRIPMPNGKKRCKIKVSERVYELVKEKDKILVVGYDKGSYKQLFAFDKELKGIRKRKGDKF